MEYHILRIFHKQPLIIESAQAQAHQHKRDYFYLSEMPWAFQNQSQYSNDNKICASCKFNQQKKEKKTRVNMQNSFATQQAIKFPSVLKQQKD